LDLLVRHDHYLAAFFELEATSSPDLRPFVKGQIVL